MKLETLRCGGRLVLRISSEPFIQVATDFRELQDIHLAMTCSLDAINLQYMCRLPSTLSKSVKTSPQGTLRKLRYLVMRKVERM